MLHNLTAEIISIGTEILLGELTDTNSAFIARVFRDLGINVYFMTSVGDNEDRIAESIRIASSRAQIVITCGGLGPTVDDKTRQAVAKATDRELSFHQTLLDQIAARFESFGVKMTENNRQQAFLPDHAIVVANPVGTAPSFIVEVGDGAVISLPGVPREMKFLLQEKIVPYLRQRYPLGIIKARTLKVAGIGESSLDDMIGRDLLENSNPTIGLAAHHGEVDIRITAKGKDEAVADAMIAETEVKLRERIGRFVFGVDNETLQDVLVQQLQKTNQRIAFLHAGVEDVLTRLIVSANPDSNVIAQTLTFEHPDEVYAAYGIVPSVSMRELAADVASKLCEDSGADVSIVIISNPEIDEGEDTDQASVVHVFTPQKSRDRAYGFGGRSEIMREWVSRWALSNAWRMLREQTDGS